MTSLSSLSAIQPSEEASTQEEARRIVEASVALLRQGVDLLEAMPAEGFTQPVGAASNATIGGHYRHCLDHFGCLLRALDSGLVDYDRRDRDVRLETDRGFALGFSRTLLSTLERIDLTSLEVPVLVRSEVSYEPGKAALTRSSLGRELVYAIAHGIHHYALIGVMARIQGLRLPETFGVAPSTLVHRREAAHD
jgi:uncharacterized damage-inducible protein DinB